MPVVTYPVAANADDYTQNVVTGSPETGGTTLNAQRNSIVFPPGVNKYAVTEIDTSAIPDDNIIRKATYRFYSDSYSATRGISKIFSASLWTGSGWTTIATDEAFKVGWIKLNLSASDLQYISKTGNTKLRVTVTDPGAGNFRSMFVRAREHTFGLYKAELEIAHFPSYIYGTVIG